MENSQAIKAEERRLKLNESLKENTRLKLKLSPKNWKRLKKFHEEYKRQLAYRIPAFFESLILNNLTPENDDAVQHLEQHIESWKDWVRYHSTKLGLHSKEGRQDLLDEFENLVNKQLQEDATKAEQEKVIQNALDVNILAEIVGHAVTGGVKRDDIDLSQFSDYSSAIKHLKSFVRRGEKQAFEQAAKQVIKNSLS